MQQHNKPHATGSPTPAAGQDIDYSKPVAYDTQGRPLYLRPPEDAAPNQAGAASSTAAAAGTVAATATVEGPADGSGGGWSPAFNPQSHGAHQYVHVTRPIAPSEAPIPDEIMAKSEQSKREHPNLNLSRGEYIIMSLKRHPIGIVAIWGGTFLAIIALAAVMALFISGADSRSDLVLLATAGLALISFFAIGIAMVATYIYKANTFYLTNESVIQEIQVGIFNKHEQTVSLANIEDASYYKQGIASYFFDYGMIRLSTEGDETTYRFTYVTQPKQSIAILNNAVEAFKNGRPVE